MPRTSRIVPLVLAAGALASASASAAPGGVAYVDAGQVHVATLDGAKRIQLSTGEAWWNAVAQSDTGGVLATKNEPGKIAQLSSFQTWDAAGAPARFGPLNSSAAGASLAMPLTLELTASNGLMLYGFSALTFGFPTSTLERGYYAQPTATAAVGPPLKQTALRWPTLAGDRVVGTPDELILAVMNADGDYIGTQTTPWLDFSGTGAGAQLHRTSVSTDGRVVAAEVAFETDGTNSTYEQERIAMLRTPGLGQSPLPGDCWLPAVGRASMPSVSADGTLVAWKDDQGVKVGGVPDFSGADPCALTRAPVVIAVTGTSPALGPMDVDAIVAARTPAPPAPPAPTVAAPTRLAATPPTRVTVAALTASKGILVRVATPARGLIRVSLTVAPRLVGRRGTTPIVIATGRATVSAAGRFTLRVRSTPVGRALRTKLRGKRAVMTVRVGTRKITRAIVLR